MKAGKLSDYLQSFQNIAYNNQKSPPFDGD